MSSSVVSELSVTLLRLLVFTIKILLFLFIFTPLLDVLALLLFFDCSLIFQLFFLARDFFEEFFASRLLLLVPSTSVTVSKLLLSPFPKTKNVLHKLPPVKSYLTIKPFIPFVSFEVLESLSTFLFFERGKPIFSSTVAESVRRRLLLLLLVRFGSFNYNKIPHFNK